jgi:hypothetical protein
MKWNEMEWNEMKCANGSVAEWNARTEVWRNGMRERKCGGNEMRERNIIILYYNTARLLY